MRLNLLEQDIELLPERAVLWHQEKALIFSDVHLGKAESLQAQGVPLPSGAHLQDLHQIDRLIQKFSIKRAIILGDLIHDRNSWSHLFQQDLRSFLEFHSQVRWDLLIGNHEKGSMRQLREFPFHLSEHDLTMGPFIFSHGHKLRDARHFEMRGHTHPIIYLRQGPIELRLPCFVLKKKSLTLPAFGVLTGGKQPKFGPNDRVFATTEQSVFEVPRS